MTDYPEKTCSIDRLVPHEKLVAAALAGKKTQQRRAGVYAYPGETFELEGVEFVVKDLRQAKLADMTDAEAQLEGYPNMQFYRELILRMHKGMEWNPDEPVWVHEFERSAP